MFGFITGYRLETKNKNTLLLLFKVFSHDKNIRNDAVFLIFDMNLL